MAQNKSRREIAAETFQNSSDMTEREAEAYVLRELAGVGRGRAAVQLGDVSESTVDTLHQRAKNKARLPSIAMVQRVSASNTGSAEGKSYEVWFENDAMLRYVWNDEHGEIREETYRADDPRSTHESFGVGGSEDELGEYTLESIEEYTKNYRDDVAACKSDWTHIYEALTCYKA